MEPQTAQKIIRTLGLKQYVVATACEIHPTTFSKYLHGKVGLRKDELAKIKCYFTKIQEAL